MKHRTLRPVRTLAMLAGAFALAGCASGLEGLVATHESDSFLTTGSVIEVTQTTALASLPREAGRVLSVREQRREDGLQQHIVMSGDALARGENWIKVDIASRRALEAPSHHQLHSEMTGVFGGRALPLHNYVITNDHGPVGLAFGQVEGQGGCAYIWQQVSQSSVQATDRLPFARAAGVWSVRARLCRERLTLDHAVAFAQGLSLGAFSDPLFAPLASTNAATQTIAPATLAALDEAPARAPQPLARERRLAASAVPAPIAAPVVIAANQAPSGGAVTIALPDQPAAVSAPAQSQADAPQTVAQAPAAAVSQATIAVPLPQ